MVWVIALVVAGLVITYLLWTAGGARAANPEWNYGDELRNDGETDGFESDWDHYKERKTGDSGPGWDS